jgi:hypothetical protein
MLESQAPAAAVTVSHVGPGELCTGTVAPMKPVQSSPNNYNGCKCN